MKKILALMLALAMMLALAACGDTKQAEVVENVDPNDNNIVIETPPAVVSGTDNTQPDYTPDTTLPTTTTAPTTAPSTEPTSVPPATTAPSTNPDGTTTGGDNSGNTGNTGSNNDDDDGLQSYHASITKKEIENGKDGYITGEGVNFRVGPGTQYSIIESLAKNTKILIVGETTNGWIKVWYNDYVGYVSRSYVTTTPPAEESPAPTEEPTTGGEEEGEPVFVDVP